MDRVRGREEPPAGLPGLWLLDPVFGLAPLGSSGYRLYSRYSFRLWGLPSISRAFFTYLSLWFPSTA